MTRLAICAGLVISEGAAAWLVTNLVDDAIASTGCSNFDQVGYSAI